MPKDYTHEGVEYRARIKTIYIDVENDFVTVTGDRVDKAANRTTTPFDLTLTGDAYVEIATVVGEAGEITADLSRRALWTYIEQHNLLHPDLQNATALALTEVESLKVANVKVRKQALIPATEAPLPVADTEFPNGDTPYSRAIATEDFESLAFTLHKRGNQSIGERMEFTAAELFTASKEGWESWPETDDQGNVSTVMQKKDGIIASPNDWVSVHVVVRVDEVPGLVWLLIRDENWGTVRDVEVIHA